MSSVRTHFEDRAAMLWDRAAVGSVEKDGAVMTRLRPNAPTAVSVVLYLFADRHGTGSRQASAP